MIFATQIDSVCGFPYVMPSRLNNCTVLADKHSRRTSGNRTATCAKENQRRKGHLKDVFCVSVNLVLLSLAAQNRESRIAQFPESQAWNRRKFRSEKQNNESESNRSRIVENRFRIAIRIVSHECLKRAWNRAIRITRF